MSDTNSCVGVEKPILFSAPMVRAILEGRKTQTRRALKGAVPPPPAMDAIHPNNQIKHPAPYLDSYCNATRTEANPRRMSRNWCWWTRDDRQCLPMFPVRWVPGDRLWVRETWCAVDDTAYGGEKWVDYRATPRHSAEHPAGWDNDPSDPVALKWRPSICMPRWASRITLEVTDVRVERLQAISEADAIAEGIEYRDGCWGTWDAAGAHTCGGSPDPIEAYRCLWLNINGAGSWDANPWIVAVTFRRVANA